MERRLNVKAVMEIYGFSRQTAARYMRKLPHMENPLMILESELQRWDNDRTVYPGVRPEKVRKTDKLPYRR